MYSLAERGNQMPGYYPDNVTGFEPEISGAQYEDDETRNVECDECDEDVYGEAFEGRVTGTLTVWNYFERTFYWTCPTCGYKHEDEDDPDDYGPDVD